MATGAVIDAIDETSSATPAIRAPGVATVRNTAGSMRSTRSTATARCVRSTVGSLSRTSTDSHTNRGCLRAAHCDNNVVLP